MLANGGAFVTATSALDVLKLPSFPRAARVTTYRPSSVGANANVAAVFVAEVTLYVVGSSAPARLTLQA